jgi:hypothetical protein
VRELRAGLANESHIRLLYQCSRHHTTSPLHPLIEQLERAAGFAAGDRAEEKLEKLEALLARGTDRLDQAVPLIAALLGVPTEDRYPALDLTPQRQKQLALAALVEQLEGLAAAQPVLLTYEDMHWSDPTNAGAARPDHRAPPAPAGASVDHLPAGVQPAVAFSAAPQRARALLAGQLAHEHHDRIGETRFELGEVLGKLDQAALPEGELAGRLAYAGQRLLDRPAKDAADGFEPREADPVDPLLVLVRLLIGDPDQLGKPLLRDAESYSALADS